MPWLVCVIGSIAQLFGDTWLQLLQKEAICNWSLPRFQLFKTVLCLPTALHIFNYGQWLLLESNLCCCQRNWHLKLSDFRMDYALVVPNEVRAVVCEVKGKTDWGPKLLTIYRDDEFPELCHICALMSYLQMWAPLPVPYFHAFPSITSSSTILDQTPCKGRSNAHPFFLSRP